MPQLEASASIRTYRHGRVDYAGVRHAVDGRCAATTRRLATEWTFSADKTALTLKLRDKVKFHTRNPRRRGRQGEHRARQIFQLRRSKALAPISDQGRRLLTVELAISSRFGEIPGTLPAQRASSPGGVWARGFRGQAGRHRPVDGRRGAAGHQIQVDRLPRLLGSFRAGGETIGFAIPPEAIVNALMDGSATNGVVRTTAVPTPRSRQGAVQKKWTPQVTWIWGFAQQAGIFANEALRQALWRHRPELSTIFKTLVYGDSTPNSQASTRTRRGTIQTSRRSPTIRPR